MTTERTAGVRRVRPSSPEKFRLRPLPEGVFETVLLYVKRAFPQEIMGVDDTSFWVEIEQMSGAFQGSKKEAIFQYYLRGVNHVSLAESLLGSFPRLRTAVALGEISIVQRRNLISQVANTLYDDYPPRYKKAHPKTTSA